MSASATVRASFDLILRGGTVVDGRGGAPFVADVGVRGEHIAAIGDLTDSGAATVIDAAGMTVAPGFINMLSHSYFSMLQDPRSLGELKQGVTLQDLRRGQLDGPANAGDARTDGEDRRPTTRTSMSPGRRWRSTWRMPRTSASRRTSRRTSVRRRCASTPSGRMIDRRRPPRWR